MNEHIGIEDLSAFLDDELPQPRAAYIGAHLELCPECSARLDELRWTVAFTRAMPLSEFPAGRDLAVAEAAEPARPFRVSGRVRSGTWIAVGSLAAVALIALGTIWQAGHRATSTERALLGPEAELAASAGSDDLGGFGEDASAGVPDTLAGGPGYTDFSMPPPPDSSRAGYPRPLATARQEDFDQRGGVPPPELGQGLVVPTVSPADRRSAESPPAAASAGDAASASVSEDRTAPEPSVPEGRTAMERPQAARSAAGPTAAQDSLPSEELAATSQALERVLNPGLVAVVLVAAMLMLASAVLFVRSWTR